MKKEQILNPLVRDYGWLEAHPGNEGLLAASRQMEDLWQRQNSEEMDTLSALYVMHEMYRKHLRESQHADVVGAFLIQSIDEFAFGSGLSQGVIRSVESYVQRKSNAGLL